jgi:hypothetical protein
MKQIILFIFLSVGLGLSTKSWAQAPTITSFTPTSGAVGATVTITGTGFDTTPANNIVFFGATRATVTAAIATSLTVTVPTGATFGAITVLNTGTSLAAYSTQFFNPTFSPNKSSITTADIAAQEDFTAVTNPRSVAIGDLDGDGKPDLAVTNNGSATVSVYRNTSSSGLIAAGSFAAKVDFTTGSSPRSVAIGDLDGDGKPDLAVGNYSSATVSVFLNTSTSGLIDTGSFAAKVDFTTGTRPNSVAIGDLDGDGKPDLAVANNGSATVSVLHNTYTSGLIVAGSFAAKVDFTTGSIPISVAIGDLDGDGKPDLAVANFSSSSVSVLHNTYTSGLIDTGSFAAKVDFTTGTNPYSVAIGDLDGDGKPDLAVANSGSDIVSVLHNTYTSGLIDTGSFAAKVDFATGSSPRSVVIGDLDGDGKPDLAVANFSSSSVSVFRNTYTSGLIDTGSFAAKVDFTTGSNPISVAIGDLDGDGKPDLAVANFSSNTVSVYRNTSNDATLSALTTTAGTLSPAFASATTAYTASVANATTSVTVTPTRAEANAAIQVRVNGGAYTSVTSGSASLALSLNVGSNTINVLVTAQDSTTTNSYTITVTRNSNVATLSALTTTAGTLSPTFAAATTAYTASVANATTSVTVTPTRTEANASIQVRVNGGAYTSVTSGSASLALSLNVGSNTIDVLVTAQDGTTTNSYTITVTRNSNDATLSALTTTAGTLSPTFAAATTAYTASVSNATTSITVTPTVAEANATITVNGTAVASGAASGNITLTVGANVITTIVTAQDGTTLKTYTLTVTRATADQTITFPALASKTTSDVDYEPGATVNSGLALRYTSSNTAVATVYQDATDGNKWKISIQGSGTTDITAIQDGNSDYNSASFLRGLTVGTSLPVTVVNYDAKLNTNGTVQLTWLTASETNNSYFELQRSTDGINFTTIVKVTGAGNSTQEKRYDFIDLSPLAGTNYYKLVQYDFDGKATVLATKVINVSLVVTTEVSVYPNPVNDVVYIKFKAGVYNIAKLIDLKGSVLSIKSVNKEQSLATFEMADLPLASYILQLEGNTGTVSKTIIKK